MTKPKTNDAPSLSTLAREHWGEAPEAVRGKIREALHDGREVVAIDLAAASGFRVDAADLPQRMTKAYAQLPDERERARFRGQHGSQLRLEARALERLRAYTATGFYSRTRAEESAAERARIEAEAAEVERLVQARAAAILSAREEAAEHAARAQAEREVLASYARGVR